MVRLVFLHFLSAFHFAHFASAISVVYQSVSLQTVNVRSLSGACLANTCRSESTACNLLKGMTPHQYQLDYTELHVFSIPLLATQYL